MDLLFLTLILENVSEESRSDCSAKANLRQRSNYRRHLSYSPISSYYEGDSQWFPSRRLIDEAVVDRRTSNTGAVSCYLRIVSWLGTEIPQ